MKYRTAFLSQTVDQAERTIHTLKDMLKSDVIDFLGRMITYNWLSSPTTIVTIQAFPWHLLMVFMVKDIGIFLNGLRFVSLHSLVQILSMGYR